MCKNKVLIVTSFAALNVVLLYILQTGIRAGFISQSSKDGIVLTNAKRCAIILRQRNGRLGNRLFIFASAYGLSLNRSCLLYIDPSIISELNKSFEINLPHLLSQSQLNHSPPIQKIYNHCSFFPQLLGANNSYSIELSGFWQVHKYFIDHMEEIRRQLRFKRTIIDRVNSFLDKNVNTSVSTLVGIHIRRGDFLLVRRVSSDKYIFNAMSYFIAKYGSVIFVIVSDDKKYCRKVFGQRSNVLLTPDSFSVAEDLATLTVCEHNILTVGTFGWWGAFLSQNRAGDVVTDSKPDHTPLDANCHKDDYFPPWFSFLNSTN